MQIALNGEKREIPNGLNVLGLLEFLKIRPERVAVELNLDIVRKHSYGSTPVKEGDSIEVVSFMQGGTCALRNCKL